MLTCSLRSIHDNFVQQTLLLAPIDLPKDLFSCKIHQGKIDKSYRVLVANLATNFGILVARAVVSVALVTVLGTISCPEYISCNLLHSYLCAKLLCTRSVPMLDSVEPVLRRMHIKKLDVLF